MDKVYMDTLLKMDAELDRLGDWEYSPNGKDSIWQKTLITHNLTLLDDVLNKIKPIKRELDSLIFIAKKYDSIPYPTEEIIEREIDIIKEVSTLMEYRITLSGLVEYGVYDQNGKKLKDYK